MSERLEKLRGFLADHECPDCAEGQPCRWADGVRRLIRVAEEEERAAAPQPIPDQAGLKPGREGYVGHKTGPGVKKAWRPRTLRNQKKFFRNRENWARFKETARIDGRITFRTAYTRAGIHHFTLSHYVNGLTDVKLSTALDLCDKLHCKIQHFSAAMKEAWELAERRYQSQEAINEAVRESDSEKGLDAEGSEA
jgi:hypothetical protein